MADNDVWILGAAMTKFGRYRDKDVIDLASDASMAALQDGGVTIQDMDVMGAGNLMEASSGIGQRIQKQIGQTGIPVFNVANACATGATAIRCGSARRARSGAWGRLWRRSTRGVWRSPARRTRTRGACM